MSFTIIKTATIPDPAYLERLISESTDITASLESIQITDGTDLLSLTFAGAGPLTTTENVALDAILTSYVVPDPLYQSDSSDLYVRSMGGRMYCYTDKRWVTPNDDLYTDTYYQWVENCGTQENPLIEWEHQGTFLKAGDIVRDFIIVGRMNHVTVTDVEMVLVKSTPNPITRWETGIDNDAEMINEVIYRDFFKNNSSGIPLTGASNDKMRRKIDIDHHVEFDSELRLYLRPLGTMTATRYFYANIRFSFLTS